MKIECVGADQEYTQPELDALETMVEVAMDAHAGSAAAMGLDEDETLMGKSFLVFKIDHKWATVVLRVDDAELIPGLVV